jgi:hypothetical protein
MYQIKTSDYTKVYDIEVDGEHWQMKSPGAGDELIMGQAQRRMKLLNAKIDNGTATSEDLDLYDELEKSMFDLVTKIFKDTTPDNHNVKKWVLNTPMQVIIKAIESIKTQVQKEADNGNGADNEAKA